MRRVVGVVAAAVAVVVIVVVAAVAAAAAAAAAELLPLSPRACVQPGSVQSVVQMCALNLMVCAGSCARLGHPVSVRAAGAGQWVQGGLAEPPAGVRGSLLAWGRAAASVGGASAAPPDIRGPFYSIVSTPLNTMPHAYLTSNSATQNNAPKCHTPSARALTAI